MIENLFDIYPALDEFTLSTEGSEYVIFPIGGQYRLMAYEFDVENETYGYIREKRLFDSWETLIEYLKIELV